MTDTQQLEILAFTDPVCTWCWGSEPTLRKLQVWYGNQIRITPVMGGLVEDIRNFYDQANHIGGDPEKTNQQIASHWLEASERHGMPVEINEFQLFSTDIVSTYPQNIAYKAVEMCNPELVARYLRRIRKASASEAKETGRREVLIELASDIGVNIAEFIRYLDNGDAQQAFHADLLTTRQYGVRGFPTFLFRWDDKEIMLRGHQTYESIRAVMSSLSQDQLQPSRPDKKIESIIRFIADYGHVADIEISTVFELSAIEQNTIFHELMNHHQVRSVSAGNGRFWEVKTMVFACNPATQTCSI